MLQLTINGGELFDERASKFIKVKPQTLQLEHSLVSISKWEAKWKKPYLNPRNPMTYEETIDYIRFMTVSPQHVDPNVYRFINDSHVKAVMEYINDPMTATTISDSNRKRGPQQVLTSELIYYYMTAYQIPFDPCQKWHFNRLMTLIRVCDAKQQKPTKMSQSEINSRNRARNAARKARYNTRG